MPLASGNSNSGLKRSLLTLCIQVWQYVNAQSEQTVFQSTAREFSECFSLLLQEY